MKFVFLVLLLLPTFVHAYPEMVRHGYTNCTTCHVSANGGGVMTEYGRSLSNEVMSQFGTQEESRFMYFYSPPEWLQLGGNVRFIQTLIDTPTFRQAKFITMQADLEAAVTYDKFQVVGTLGKSDNQNASGMGEYLLSRRHYLNFKATDEISIRGGRFYPAYGLLVADHTLATRRGLGFEQGQETYNLEGSYLGEKFDFFATGIFGRPDKKELQRESGVAVRSAFNFKESYKVGASFYSGSNDRQSRTFFGPYAILGFRKDLFALFEFDIVKNTPKTTNLTTTGLAHYARLNYEVVKGFHVYLTEDVFKTNWDDPSTTANTFGAGLQWFPRPHLEFIAQFQKTKIWAVDPDNFNDYIWFQLHFYP